MPAELIYQETVQAIAAGILLSAPSCLVCQDGPLALCHCPRGAGFAWFDLDEPEVLTPGRVTPPAPVHRQDTSVVMPTVDAGDASTQVMPAIPSGPQAQRSA